MSFYNKNIYRIAKKCLLETFVYSYYIMKYRTQHCRFYDFCSLISAVKLTLKRQNLSEINDAKG